MFLNRLLSREKGIFLLLFALAVLVASVVIMSMVPPVSKDALVHHLAVPKLYLNHGGIYEIPFMDFSYYPMNLDLLYMIPLYFGNDIIPKLIHFAFALSTAWIIFIYLKKRAGILYGLSGAVFFLSTPVIVKLSINVYVDLGIIFFSFAALLLILKWLNTDFKTRYLIYSGIMCGLALGTKYNGLITFVILALFIPYLYSRSSRDKIHLYRRSLFHFLTFVLTALVIFSPWMIRNYYWKGNPIYPLYNSIFKPSVKTAQENANRAGEETVSQNRGFFTFRGYIYGESALEIAALPLRIFFEGRDGDPRYFDGKLNPFLLIFTILAFLPLKNIPAFLRREKMIFLIFSILFFSMAFFTAVLRIRYISPIIPPLTVLSMLGIKNLLDLFYRKSSWYFRTGGSLLVVVFFTFSLTLNMNYIIKLYKEVDPLPYIMGEINRDDYISKFIPEYPALKFINTKTDKDSRIFFIYMGKRGYYCDREYEFNPGFLHNLILKARTPYDIFSGFRKKRITHLLIFQPLFQKWVRDNCSVERQQLLRNFFLKYSASVFYRNGFELMVLKSNG